MSSQRIALPCLLIVLLAAGGCRWTGWHQSFQSAAAEPGTTGSMQRAGSGVQQASSTAELRQGDQTSEIPGFPVITPVDSTSPPIDDAVLRELQIISASDPMAAQQLMAQLQEIKPSLRPLAAQQFRASWQYHRELTGHSTSAPAVPIATASQPPTPLPPVDPAAATPPPAATTTSPAAEPTTPPAETAPEPAGEEQAAAKPAAEVQLASHAESLAETSEEKAEEKAEEPAEAEEKKLAASSGSTESLLAWRDSVDAAIAQLVEATPDEPRSTHEAYQLARLRMLQLIAGDGQAPMEPIPGLTPTEQGYWSGQLFALHTMLDHTTHADDQQRAALARSQLQEADRKLGELSQLAILNLSFCTKVLAFGNYLPIEQATFTPGQAVRLYAELENFRSDSTDKGYHTSLATSYEVLDKNGDRVAQGEFATIDDYCLRRRRDFYMEFALDLPSRIYASNYTLQINVRDRLSGKLAKSSVPFTIAE